MKKEYLSLAKLITPSVLNEFMNDPKHRTPEFFSKMVEKYGDYFRILRIHCMNDIQFSGAGGTLYVVMECLEKVLNDSSRLS
jgi:hypothetical protein